jgi:hypothetical protein
MLKPAQRRTLEMACCIVLSGLGFGFQLGSWPLWTFLAGIGIYLAWVALYAEITFRTTRDAYRLDERRKDIAPASRLR